MMNNKQSTYKKKHHKRSFFCTLGPLVWKQAYQESPKIKSNLYSVPWIIVLKFHNNLDTCLEKQASNVQYRLQSNLP